jgi:WD40 repeat protein
VSLDKKIVFYDISDKKVVKKLETTQPLTSISFFEDGHTIAVGTLSGSIFIYDLRESA